MPIMFRVYFFTLFMFSCSFAITSAMPSPGHLHERAFKTHKRWRGHKPHQLLAEAIATSSSVPEPTPTQDLTPEQVVYLDGHNLLRMQFNAANLSWSDDLSSAAHRWANSCEFEHSGGSLGPYGETLAAGTGDFTILGALDVWAGEASRYDPVNPAASDFTQMVWQSTTEVGCAASTCDSIFPSSGPARYFVCEYFPAGNVIGQFQDNVQI